MRRALLPLVLVAAGVYALGAVLFLARDDDPLRRADAVVVLAGGEERLPLALGLMERGVAPVLLVSKDVSGKDRARTRLCARGRIPQGRLLCREAVPFSTRGEARLIAELARDRGWRRIVLVTSRYHLLRARMLVRRCSDVAIVERGTRGPWTEPVLAVPLEWAKLALAETFRRGC